MVDSVHNISSLQENFIHVCRVTPTAVNVVSTNGPGGVMAQTISAVMIAAHNPPTIAISVQNRSPMVDAVEKNQSFTVNVLSVSHDHVADTFAGRPWPGKDRWDFSCGPWHPGADNTAPYLDDAVAVLRCRVHDSSNLGSHILYTGLVEYISHRESVPLIYHNANYCSPVITEPSSFPEFPDAHPAKRYNARIQQHTHEKGDNS